MVGAILIGETNLEVCVCVRARMCVCTTIDAHLTGDV